MDSVTSIINNRGNAVANQFCISNSTHRIFQSYNSRIATIRHSDGQVTLDPEYWDYSVTTLKHLKTFLGTTASKKVIIERIESGEYKTRKLN